MRHWFYTSIQRAGTPLIKTFRPQSSVRTALLTFLWGTKKKKEVIWLYRFDIDYFLFPTILFFVWWLACCITQIWQSFNYLTDGLTFVSREMWGQLKRRWWLTQWLHGAQVLWLNHPSTTVFGSWFDFSGILFVAPITQNHEIKSCAVIVFHSATIFVT